MENHHCLSAVDAVLRAESSFCKFLSANDSGETGGHQSGILISMTAAETCFSKEEIWNNHIMIRQINIIWQNDFSTESVLTWYESKKEIRITRFGRGFPFRGPEYTGALFVLTRADQDNYRGFIFNTEEEINEFLDTFGLTPAETNCPERLSQSFSENREQKVIEQYIRSLDVDFPTSEEMSAAARRIFQQISTESCSPVQNPDKILLDWTNEEYSLFQAIEQERYGKEITDGFSSMESFVSLANKVLNRRKSRAGKSLEHHLSCIFDENQIQYSAQAITEKKKKPDFIFPSVEAYHDMTFSIDKICTLAAKTTCKDRWRQILNEADRLKDDTKYLCTLQQSISGNQMDEMQSEKVVLVVPEPYIRTYPADHRDRIWTLKHFVEYIRELEAS